MKSSNTDIHGGTKVYTSAYALCQLACIQRTMWGVYCSWASYYDNNGRPNKARQEFLRSCLPPGEFAEVNLPDDCWFLRLFDDEACAREYYKHCRGDDHGSHDAIYAVLIDNTGKLRAEST